MNSMDRADAVINFHPGLDGDGVLIDRRGGRRAGHGAPPCWMPTLRVVRSGWQARSPLNLARSGRILAGLPLRERVSSTARTRFEQSRNRSRSTRTVTSGFSRRLRNCDFKWLAAGNSRGEMAAWAVGSVSGSPPPNRRAVATAFRLEPVRPGRHRWRFSLSSLPPEVEARPACRAT